MISIIYGSSTILNVWQITINFYLIIEHKQGGGFTQQDWVLRSLLTLETETGISHVSYAMDLLSFYAPPHTLSHWMSADQGQQPMTLDSGIKWVINWNKICCLPWRTKQHRLAKYTRMPPQCLHYLILYNVQIFLILILNSYQ